MISVSQVYQQNEVKICWVPGHARNLEADRNRQTLTESNTNMSQNDRCLGPLLHTLFTGDILPNDVL